MTAPVAAPAQHVLAQLQNMQYLQDMNLFVAPSGMQQAWTQLGAHAYSGLCDLHHMRSAAACLADQLDWQNSTYMASGRHGAVSIGPAHSVPNDIMQGLDGQPQTINARGVVTG